MDVSAIAGVAVTMKAAQGQQAMIISLIKMAAEQQQAMANMLAQSAASNGGGFNFSIYA